MQTELNRFLQSHRILEMENELIRNDKGSVWCFCIKYLEPIHGVSTSASKKIDYKKDLDENTFKVFSSLREIRKKIAIDDGIPAYAVFTDEELASIAKLESVTKSTLLSVKGIGDKKIERFADRLMNKLGELKS